MKNILFISSYPFPLNKGSNQHAFYFIKALATSFNVYGIFFVQPGDPLPDKSENLPADLNIRDYGICRFSPAKKRGRFSATVHRLCAFPGSYMDLATNSSSLARIQDFIEQYDIDTVHIEHLHYFKYALLMSNKLKKVIVYHDLYHTIYSQKVRFEKNITRKILLWIDCSKIYLFQRILDFYVDAKIFLNTDEMKALPKKSIHIPHVANQDIVFRTPRETDFINLLFIGAYKHPPNVMSVEFIIKHILPLLAEQTDRFRLHLVGSGMEQFQPLVDDTGFKKFIDIRGFISNINEAFKNMDIALFPILYGGGIKTKTLDAMAAGVPVVTTPEGVIGLSNIPADCIAVGKTPAELVEQVLRLMNNYHLRSAMSQSGKKYYDQQNSYTIFIDRVKNAYQRI